MRDIPNAKPYSRGAGGTTSLIDHEIKSRKMQIETRVISKNINTKQKEISSASDVWSYASSGVGQRQNKSGLIFWRAPQLDRKEFSIFPFHWESFQLTKDII